MANSINDLRQMLIYVVRAVVDAPDEISVVMDADGTAARFLIKVTGTDVGKVIGRQGRTITSIRRVVLAAAQPLHLQVSIDVDRPADAAAGR